MADLSSKDMDLIAKALSENEKKRRSTKKAKKGKTSNFSKKGKKVIKKVAKKASSLSRVTRFMSKFKLSAGAGAAFDAASKLSDARKRKRSGHRSQEEL